MRRAISRILSPESSSRGRSFLSSGQSRKPAPYRRRMRLLPGGCPAFAEPDRQPGLLLCLAPHGVFRAPALARRAVGSYPAFSPLPAPRCRVAGGLIFCDTFRRPRLGPRGRPRVLRGMSPCGVRTFLPASAAAAPGDRLPSARRNIHGQRGLDKRDHSLIAGWRISPASRRSLPMRRYCGFSISGGRRPERRRSFGPPRISGAM